MSLNRQLRRVGVYLIGGELHIGVDNGRALRNGQTIEAQADGGVGDRRRVAAIEHHI